MTTVANLLIEYGFEEIGGGDNFTAYGLKCGVSNYPLQVYVYDDGSWQFYDFFLVESDLDPANALGSGLDDLTALLRKGLPKN